MATFTPNQVVEMPSGMGGVLPAVIAKVYEEESQVICISAEFYPLWLITVKNSDLRDYTNGYLTEKSKALLAKARKNN